MNESGRDRDSQMIPGAWTQSSVANPAYGTRTYLTLAEGARGVGGQRTALVLPLQPRLHPQSLRQSVLRSTPSQSSHSHSVLGAGQIQPCMLCGICH